MAQNSNLPQKYFWHIFPLFPKHLIKLVLGEPYLKQNKYNIIVFRRCSDVKSNIQRKLNDQKKLPSKESIYVEYNSAKKSKISLIIKKIEGIYRTYIIITNRENMNWVLNFKKQSIRCLKYPLYEIF